MLASQEKSGLIKAAGRATFNRAFLPRPSVAPLNSSYVAFYVWISRLHSFNSSSWNCPMYPRWIFGPNCERNPFPSRRGGERKERGGERREQIETHRLSFDLLNRMIRDLINVGYFFFFLKREIRRGKGGAILRFPSLLNIHWLISSSSRFGFEACLQDDASLTLVFPPRQPFEPSSSFPLFSVLCASKSSTDVFFQKDAGVF